MDDKSFNIGRLPGRVRSRRIYFSYHIALKKGLNPSAVFAISVLYLAALFGICYLILRQTSGSSGKPRGEKTNAEDEYALPKKFRSEITKQLDEPQTEPVPSVTEHTTRTLDEVLVERK